MFRNYRSTQYFVLALTCLMLVFNSNAQIVKHDDLSSVIQSFKSWNRYGYQATISMQTPDNKNSNLERKVYFDRTAKKIFIADNTQILIVNEKDVIQIDHVAKNFKIFNKAEYERVYNKRENNINSFFNKDFFNEVLNEFLSKKRNVVSTKRSNNIKVFRVTQSDDYLEVIFEVEVNEKESSVKSMNYSVFDNDDKRNPILTTKLYNYEHDFSSSVFSSAPYFITNNDGSYKLLQYKNYKLLTKVK